jgi:uncharacterized OsmC-like protein
MPDTTPDAGGYRHVVATTDFAASSVELRSDPHRWSLDMPPVYGGPGAALDPVGAFLGALCGCVLMSLRVTARLRELDIAGATAEARADPKGFLKRIALDIGVITPEPDDVVTDAVARAERGCFVRATIGDHVQVDTTWHRLAPANEDATS